MRNGKGEMMAAAARWLGGCLVGSVVTLAVLRHLEPARAAPQPPAAVGLFDEFSFKFGALAVQAEMRRRAGEDRLPEELAEAAWLRWQVEKSGEEMPR